MKLHFTVIFLQGAKEVAKLEGVHDIDGQHLTLSEAQKIIEAEQFLERLTGYRVHIESAVVEATKT